MGIKIPLRFGEVFLKFTISSKIDDFKKKFNSESAGAVSVHYQMISPLSEGLFHRGISNSGGLTGTAGPARTGVAREQANTLAQQLNCPILDNTLEIVRCLRTVSPEDMINEGGSFPIVVEDFESDEPAFIDQQNYNNRFSNYAAIPLLVGMNSEDGLLYLSGKNDTLKRISHIEYFLFKHSWKMMQF